MGSPFVRPRAAGPAALTDDDGDFNAGRAGARLQDAVFRRSVMPHPARVRHWEGENMKRILLGSAALAAPAAGAGSSYKVVQKFKMADGRWD